MAFSHLMMSKGRRGFKRPQVIEYVHRSGSLSASMKVLDENGVIMMGHMGRMCVHLNS